MSPRGAAAASSSSSRPSPYARRPANQPKSSRQQFSACGACRMRRVRCDLKDLPAGFVGPHPACSNCKERGIKCVDEFADVKAVKLLRRGRRLQQVEAIYGKASSGNDSDSHQQHNSASPGASSRPAISIPQLQPEFFLSSFWRWFSQQRPILDSRAFPARLHAHVKGTYSLPNEASLVAMILVAWAASFGLDERGLPLPEGTDDQNAQEQSLHLRDAHDPQVGLGEGSSTSVYSQRHQPHRPALHAWKARAEACVREVLHLIDNCGILRRPSWDGVQALLLLLPLLEDAQPIERLVLHEMTLSHIQALCVSNVPVTVFEGGSGASSQQFDALTHSPYDDAAARARIFYYAYAQEGVMTGMRGGRFFLDNDDLDAFQRALPSDSYGGVDPTLFPSADLSAFPLYSPPFPVHPSSSLDALPSPPASTPSSSSMRIPLAIGAICRRIHSALTGPKALRRAEEHGLVDAHGMREIWRDLDRCWGELEARRRSVQIQAQDANDAAAADRSAEVDQYVSAWQIFIFECHNVIREALKHCITTPTQQNPSPYDDASPPRPSSHSSIGSSSSAPTSPYLTPRQLHATAMRKCAALLPRVIYILRRALQHQQQQQLSFGPGAPDGPSIFRWDAGLVRDGCFFAGYLAANTSADYISAPLPSGDEGDQDAIGAGGSPSVGTDEGVRVCLAALSAMRWGFSKSEEREDTIRMIWDSQRMRRQGQGHHVGMYEAAQADYASGPLGDAMHHHVTPTISSTSPHLGMGVGSMTGGTSSDRPMLPPLNVFGISHPSQARHLQHAHRSQRPHTVDSAPSTASSLADDRALSGWPVSYTPPGTATSLATSAGTGPALAGSRRNSPIFSSMNPAGPYAKPPPPQPQHSGGDMFQFQPHQTTQHHTSASEQQFTYSAPPPPPPHHHHSSHRQSPAGMGMGIGAGGYGMAAGTTFPADSAVLTSHADFHSSSVSASAPSGSLVPPSSSAQYDGGYHQ
ncbi:hypothetical protein D9619_005846 [Psilocybe cf. subviscida]|uniref:Zn(2)-C6 fungal-type domain-containing protein n=1 Tax=Psilocybe cf. subviscida TaxID=2480587 RepID=A0A8H5FBW7_9AGAR|nr:hypothetical protein D9619_005846 [Psilocybe cf. subviscida]